MGSAVEPRRPAERVFPGRPGPEGETPAQAPAETQWWRRFAAALAPGTLQAGRRGYHRRRGEEQREEREREEGTEEAEPAGRACRAEEDRERPLLPGPLRCCPGVGSTRSPARHAAPGAAGQGSGNPADRYGTSQSRPFPGPAVPGVSALGSWGWGWNLGRGLALPPGRVGPVVGWATAVPANLGHPVSTVTLVREGEVLTRSPRLPPLPGLAGPSHVRQRGRSPSGQVPTLGIACSLRRRRPGSRSEDPREEPAPQRSVSPLITPSLFGFASPERMRIHPENAELFSSAFSRASGLQTRALKLSRSPCPLPPRSCT